MSGRGSCYALPQMHAWSAKMSQMPWGLFCLILVVSGIVLCFRKAQPVRLRTRKESETNQHSTYGALESGSDWSSIDRSGHHHGS